jgi:polyhydroxyalkanoate synthesis regulator phasin
MEDFNQFLMGGQQKSTPPPSSSSNQFNVGNLRPAGQSTSFQQPSSFEEGIKNMDTQLGIYGTKHKINTLKGVISRYAPPSENDTEIYINFVSQKTGLKPDQEIDLSNPVVRHVISGPMILMEKGHKGIFGQAQQTSQAQPTNTFENFLTSGSAEKTTEPKKPETISEVGKQFGKDVLEPLSKISWEGFKKESLLPKIATGMAGSSEEKKQLVEDIYKGSEKFVSGVKEFAKHPLESIKAVGSELIEHPGKFVGETIKGTIYDPELAILPGGAAVKQGEKLAVKAGQAVSPAAKGMAEQFAAKQPTMAGVGAAETNLANRVEIALNEAPDYLKQSLKDVPVEKLATEENLRAIENHNKFAKFDLTPTEGQALENTSLMSSEFNSRKIDPNLQARFEERDPKLILGFNKIKEELSPDVFENDPIRLSSMALDKLKNDYVNEQANIRTLYEKANRAAGGSQAPIDIGALRENIINGLKEKQRTRYVPSRLQADLDEVLAQGYMTPEQYENFRTDTATIARTSKDPLESQAASIIREKLEQVPIKDEFAQYKPLYDEARKAVAQLKAKEKNPAYKAAIADTRTLDEIEAGVPHPAANNFLANHYSAKTPQVNIERMLDLIGRNSPEHQALNKLKIDEFKLNSGIKNDTGTISQDRLNKIIYHQNQSNLPVMFGNKVAKDLQDLADVARLSEPRKGVHSVNVSNTEILRQENAAKAAKEAAGNIVAGSAEAMANAKIPFSGTIIRKTLGGMKAEKEAKAAAKAAQEESERRLSPKAGIKLKDLGK